MIGRHRIGALGIMAIALGVVPLPLPPKPVDMAAAELLIHELQQNGLDPLSVAAHAGADSFVELARAVLTMRHSKRALGIEMTTPQLIAEVKALHEHQSMHPRDILSMRPVLGNRIPGPHMDAVTATASEPVKMPAQAPKPAKVPRNRSAQRPDQAKARAAKSRRKARKGWA